MKIAIVGTSRLTEKEKHLTRKAISAIINKHGKGDVYISGGATGVDTEVRIMAKDNGLAFVEHHPSSNNWNGFRLRNMSMAQECDVLYCITTQTKFTPCYHCNDPTHEKTAGCWTKNYAKRLKKDTHLIII